jgi:hypothetical protein
MFAPKVSARILVLQDLPIRVKGSKNLEKKYAILNLEKKFVP